VLPATNVSYLPQGDPLTSVKRSVVLLWPTFSGKNAGVGLLGTGFVVRRQGDRAWIVTALHVVRDLESNALATKVEAELFTGPLPAGVVAPRAEVLLSQGTALPASGDEPIVLEVRGLPPDIQALPLATTPAQGVLMVVGHPSKPGPWTVVSYPLLKTTDQALLLDGGLDPGASGSPVLSASRQVVGVVYDSPEVTKSRPIPQVYAFPVKALKAKIAP
jgi:superkiller protein 3